MDTRQTTGFVLQDFLPYRLSVLANGVSRQLAKTYQEQFNLSVPEWRILAVLGPNGALTASEIVEITVMDKVAVSRAVARLLDRGRVSSVRDENDRRRQVLSLTDEGRTVFQAVVPLALDYQAKLLQSLAVGERQDLLSLMNKLDSWVKSQTG